MSDCCCYHEAERLREQVARMVRAPTLEEAEFRGKLMQLSARLARNGHGADAVRLRNLVDAWRPHVDVDA